jgi:hypothetical protein
VIPGIVRVEEMMRVRLPQFAILGVNVMMIASYEYVSITAYVTVVLTVIGEILGIKES